MRYEEIDVFVIIEFFVFLREHFKALNELALYFDHFAVATFIAAKFGYVELIVNGA